MLFNSFDFLIFFPIVVAVYFLIPRKARYLWLLAASYYFYMSWNPKYALLLAFSTVVTWLSGLFIQRINQASVRASFGDEKSKKSKAKSFALRKKLVVAVSFVVNLGILAFFKYFDFILHNINVTLAVFSIQPFEKPFDLLLPVGISFYTFQALSYTVDVYRGDVSAERNPLKYALFVSFFPQLVAGPIERSKNLLAQVEAMDKLKLFNLDRITRGLLLMAWGYFLKMVIADRSAILVNNVYGDWQLYGSCELTIATVLFAFQILCDFAGYSTIAIGAAKVMGVDLMENFNAPYFASSIQDFWRRWHISLSTWFRDYLYIPLGGNRCSKLRHNINVMIVFLVSGLWHGASWTFVIWGGLHGAYQVIGGLIKPLRQRIYSALKIKTETFSWHLGQIMVTFALVCFAWIFFRADSFSQAIGIVSAIITEWDPWVLVDGSLYKLGLTDIEFTILVVAIIMLLLVDLIRYRIGIPIDEFLMQQNMGFRWTVAIALVCAVFIFGVYGPDFIPQQFIYFQF